MKLRRFRIPQNIMLILMDKVSKIINLPQDAKVHHAYLDHNSDSFFLVIESNQFKDVKEGAEIPEDYFIMKDRK